MKTSRRHSPLDIGIGLGLVAFAAAQHLLATRRKNDHSPIGDTVLNAALIGTYCAVNFAQHPVDSMKIAGLFGFYYGVGQLIKAGLTIEQGLD